MSARRKPVTGSLNLNRTRNGSLLTAGMSRISTVGGVASYTETACCAARLPLPDPSCAAFCGTSMVTGPPAAGAIVVVYAAPPPERSPAEPLPTSMSSAVKPVTGSLNLNVAVNGPLLNGGTPSIATVSGALNCDTACCGAGLPLPAPSRAAFSRTPTVTVPLPVGVISAEYTRPVPSNAPAEPLPTAMPRAVKPVTSSLNLNVAVNGPLLNGGTSRIVTVGRVPSYTETACCAARLPMPEPSGAVFAAFSGTSMVTRPSAAGVIVAEYSLPPVSVTKPLAAPLPTTMSSTVKP